MPWRHCYRIVGETGRRRPGVRKGEHDKVFQRLHRLDKSRITPGNGLGLSLARAIVDLYGATIRLEDRRPGLAVIVAFPAVKTGGA
ncbi:ATP-binding protein [Rhizobium rhizogenes]|uniref:ATP-binding protein n=1 Tax=Rhizobium rhizogenes TaxID=359 RepID=UPI001F2B5928|nr:ATP-binding protein [Rhizobium rhizogenes]